MNLGIKKGILFRVFLYVFDEYILGYGGGIDGVRCESILGILLGLFILFLLLVLFIWVRGGFGLFFVLGGFSFFFRNYGRRIRMFFCLF